MKTIIFIVGPTATGKTEIAYKLAKEIGAEIVSCDSMLVYREPSVITSKPPRYMLDEIRHHFIDIISVTKNYDVFSYVKPAAEKITELARKNRPVIVCGGSGLYVKALLDGIFEGASQNEQLRKELIEEASEDGLGVLYERLQRCDPAAAGKISPNDARRIIRALEVYETTGVPISKKQKERSGLWGKFPLRIFGLEYSRDVLYERINSRVDQMFTDGAIDEAAELVTYDLSLTAKKIIGINEIKAYLEGDSSLDEAKELMKKNTRHFAKRQVTWFKRDERIEWLDVTRRRTDAAVDEIYSKIHAI